MRRAFVGIVLHSLLLAACARIEMAPWSVRSPAVAGAMAREHCGPPASQPAEPASFPRAPGAAVPLSAQAEIASYRIVPRSGPRLPRSLRRMDRMGQLTVSLERRFDGALEEQMLERAESLYPPRQLVVLAHWCCYPGVDVELEHCRGLPRRDLRPLWWYDELDGTRVPFAITAEAIQYYLTHRAPGGPGSFTYRASVERHQTYVHPGRRLADVRRFDAVYVVHLSLQWSGVASAIHATRVVVLQAATGAPLAVFGDGAGSTIMAEADDRGAGDRRRRVTSDRIWSQPRAVGRTISSRARECKPGSRTAGRPAMLARTCPPAA